MVVTSHCTISCFNVSALLSEGQTHKLNRWRDLVRVQCAEHFQAGGGQLLTSCESKTGITIRIGEMELPGKQNTSCSSFGREALHDTGRSLTVLVNYS